MKGAPQIVNTSIDAQRAGMEEAQIRAMATQTVRYDDAEYPDGYDRNLKKGDEGYIEPIYRFETETFSGVLERFLPPAW